MTRPARRWKRRVVVAVLLLALLGGAWLLFGPQAPIGLLARYPELLGADPMAARRIRAAWPDPGMPPGGRLRAALAGEPPGSALAVLAVLLERLGEPRGWQFGGSLFDEGRCDAAGAWLAEHPDPDLDPLLLRMLADRELSNPFRRNVLIALCRPGNEAAVGPIVRLVLDRSESPEVREAALLRLPRIGAAPPEALREFLSLPYHGFDGLAAGALAILGDVRAPRLLGEALRETNDAQRTWFLAKAVLAASGGDPELAPVAEEASRFASRTSLGEEYESFEEMVAAGRDPLADAYDAWLDAHPDVRDTPFERERAAYLASDRRRRELAIDSPKAVLATPGEELDFGAAALAVTWIDADARAAYLERLDRLCRLLRRDLEGVTEPEAVLGVLARRLLPQWRVLDLGAVWPEQGPSSFLFRVLRTGTGNCVGLSSLYLAVAERLDLPLHMVAVPGHVFVRWDDGTVRRNVETTDGGKEIADDDYLTYGNPLGVDPASVERGDFLRNLTKREAVSQVLANLAHLRLSPFYENHDGALPAAEWAVRLHPRNYLAFLNRAAARLVLDPGASEEALADYERAMEIHPRCYEARIGVADTRLSLDRVEEALAWFEKARELDPDRPEAYAGRVRCLLRRGEPAEAAAAAAAARERFPEVRAFGTLLLRARILDGDPGWRETLDEIAPSAKSGADVWMLAAETHLRATNAHAPDPAAAARILDELGWVESSTPQPDPDDLLWVDEGGVTLLLEGGRERYGELRRRIEDLEGEKR